jgi:hypothetical protein
MKKLNLIPIAYLLFLSSCFQTTSTDNTHNATDSTADMHADEVGLHDALQLTNINARVEQWGVSHAITGRAKAITPDEGKKFVVIHALFDNPHNFERSLEQGTLTVTFHGRPYTQENYSSKVSDLGEGWGTNVYQIAAGAHMRTNLVYEIPDDIAGEAYWSPDNSDKSRRIRLGKITVDAPVAVK